MSEKTLHLEKLPRRLRDAGFTDVRPMTAGTMKFIDAKDVHGRDVSFWVKQGWRNADGCAAVQFGLFEGYSVSELTNTDFVRAVGGFLRTAKDYGATHMLLAKELSGRAVHIVALGIDDVVPAYRLQISKWPSRARNGKSPTLWFYDERIRSRDRECVTALDQFMLPLEAVSGKVKPPSGPGSRTVTGSRNVRAQQEQFRRAIGNRYGWRCAVTGIRIKAVLEAAHLDGRDWRLHNSAEDGILLRADLHRLIDTKPKLAWLKGGKFWLDKSVRDECYRKYHGRSLIRTWPDHN